MRIVYFANHGNINSDDTEGHIVYSLKKLGHEVHRIMESAPMAVPDEGFDLFLFHKGGPHILKVLDRVKYPKVFWYFDKVDFMSTTRSEWMARVVPKVDLGFLTDQTWLLENPNPKLMILRQGIGDMNIKLGEPREEWKIPIVFTGSVYDGREDFVSAMKLKYGRKFQVFNNKFIRELYDFCASVDIFVAPQYPSDDFYWSSRIYITLGSGGFLIHPHCEGLAAEYIDGKHYVSYKTMDELFKKVDYYLAHPDEREKIRMAGYKKTIDQFTYTKRCKTLLGVIQARLNIGTSEPEK